MFSVKFQEHKHQRCKSNKSEVILHHQAKNRPINTVVWWRTLTRCPCSRVKSPISSPSLPLLSECCHFSHRVKKKIHCYHCKDSQEQYIGTWWVEASISVSRFMRLTFCLTFFLEERTTYPERNTCTQITQEVGGEKPTNAPFYQAITPNLSKISL